MKVMHLFMYLSVSETCTKQFCLGYLQFQGKVFPVWLRNELISAGLEPFLSHTEKLKIASYYRIFFTNIKIKIRLLGPEKTGFNLTIFHFDIRGKVAIIHCDK